MTNYPINLACRNYDRTNAIHRALLTMDGVDLKVTEPQNTSIMFEGVFSKEYDVAEFSLAELVYYTSRQRNTFIGVPVFPFKMFRHGSIFCNEMARIDGPKSLVGKKIGLQGLSQTSCVWIRGILKDEYGVPADRTLWCAISDGSPEALEKVDIEPRDGSKVQYLDDELKDIHRSLDVALCSGKIDVLAGALPPLSFIRGDKRIRRLFENYPEVESAYFRSTGIFPIMHVLVAQLETVERHPDLPVKLFELFSSAKKLAQNWLSGNGSVSMAWKDVYLAHEREIFGTDPWAYGLKQNHHVIEKFLSSCYEQGISQTHIRPAELFHSSTWDLVD